ncbi:MAG: GTPase of the mitochondrial inner membrane that associates with the large ribosomal subunit [Claussenomyces sp. TS43310]|nr:MAG: GTPase of the mitochondrial inner membrane that associates with the large ribosomal subunit [Claussenomyces sp. TS43310]
MSPRSPCIQGTLTPFLYPSLLCRVAAIYPHAPRRHFNSSKPRCETTEAGEDATNELPEHPVSHLNPPPTDYSRPVFADRATVTVHAGSGGHGCISFVREKYIAAGPANGGDGGSGGNIYIQAVRGETSLHKLARRAVIKAGRGKNGQGKTRGGERGADVVIQVPVGTVVREIERTDPVAVEEELLKLEAGKEDGEAATHTGPYKWDRTKWLLYPAITKEDIATAEFPSYPKTRRSQLSLLQVPGPISLDLSAPMDKPMLLAAGAAGGLGNPHFVTRSVPRPKFATRGEAGMSIALSLELKLLADVGLVGLPNAGKSTLLRAVSNSRTRVGSWAFTTLQPNIGTVVLDDHRGRPQRAAAAAAAAHATGEARTNFTIADIPGLVRDAHLDRGLGISFLRHVERARLLAFVVDLGAGDAVAALQALWTEVGAYERMRAQEDEERRQTLVDWSPFAAAAPDDAPAAANAQGLLAPAPPSIATKPWFVIATKADLPGTRDRYEALRAYLHDVMRGDALHPSGQAKGWVRSLEAIPVSAINGHGVERITEWTVDLLDD